MNRSSMQKQMMGNLPNKEDKARQAKLDKGSSSEEVRKAGTKKFFETHNEDGTLKENKKVKTPTKKMNMGGMTAPMMGDPKSKKPMMPPKRKPAPRPAPTTDPRMKDPREKGSAMPMMKKGGKVRGAGMAKKGVRACKMR